MNDLDTNDLSPPEKIGKIRKRGKKKKKPHIGCSCQKAIDFAKAVKAAIAAPKAAAAPRSADLVKHPHTGKLVSKRSKTGRTECSQAMSDWKRGHPTPQTFTTLAKCRSIAAGYKRAQGHREAGREAMAQSLEKRYSGQHVTVKERTSRAQELKQQRREKPAASPQPAATAMPERTDTAPRPYVKPKGKSKPDRSKRIQESQAKREAEGVDLRRTKTLWSGQGTRFFEHRVRKLQPHEQNDGHTHTVQSRIYDLDKGTKTVVQDWQETGFHGASAPDALSNAITQGVTARSKLGQQTIEAQKKKSAIGRRTQQINKTIRRLEVIITGGLKNAFQAKYLEALRGAKLYKAAQSGTAPQAKIDAIVKPLKEEYESAVARAKKVLKKATKRHARLNKQYNAPLRTQSVTVEQGGTVATQAAKPKHGTRGPLPKSSKPMATPTVANTTPRPYVKPKEKPKAVGRGTPERLGRAERIKQARKKDVTTTERTERFQPGISGSDLKHGRTLYLSGNTFAHKDAIKQMGGRWNKDTQEWEVTPGTTMRERGTHSNLLHGMSRRGVRIEADRTVTTNTPKPRKGLRKRIEAILARVQP